MTEPDANIPAVQLGGTRDPHGNTAARALNSPIEQSHNRFITGVSETQLLAGHMTWTAEEKITAVRFKLLPGGTTPAHAVGHIVRVVFDSSPVDDTTDDTQAWARLQPAASSESLDVEYDELSYIPKASLVDADGAWSEWFEFGGILRRADFSYIDGNGVVSNVNILAETA